MKINIEQASKIMEMVDEIYNISGIDNFIIYTYLITKLKASINLDKELESLDSSKTSNFIINAIKEKEQFINSDSIAKKIALRNYMQFEEHCRGLVMSFEAK